VVLMVSMLAACICSEPGDTRSLAVAILELSWFHVVPLFVLQVCRFVGDLCTQAGW